MKYFLSLLISAVHLTTSSFTIASTPAAEPIKVMLQGQSSLALQELVKESGGTITHDLRIINAVGALLSQTQLDQVLKSPLVTRHIDHLEIADQQPPPPDPNAPGCEVSGGLELDFRGSSINWTLYNKKPDAARLQRMELSWPTILGEIKAVSIGDVAIDPALFPTDQSGQLSLVLDEKSAPQLKGVDQLRINFDAIPPNQIAQHEIEAELSFFGGCSTTLIPGYSDNHRNSYYPQVSGAAALHANGITGRGVTVAIVDSGLWEHESLINDTTGKPRVIARYDAINDIEGKLVFDESGHGTHMTSILAHSGPVTEPGRTGTYKGVAPDVNLVAIKAFDQEGQGDFLDIVRGLQYVVEHREALDIKVVNLSFAARPRWNYWLDPINQAVMRVWAAGITVVVAAGNEGPSAMSIGSPGNLPYVITVGAVTDSWTPDSRHDDYIPDFSSRGPTPTAHIKPDIVAPGGHMAGITRPGSTLTTDYPEYLLKTGEFVMTGTSQASALVAGIAALLLQLEPDLSPDDVKCKLMSSAEPAINHDDLLSYSPFQQGNGYVSASRAVTLGQRGCGNNGLDIHKDIADTEHFQGPAIVDEDGSVSLPGLREMVADKPSAKGFSDDRRWGVKAHIQRESYQWKPSDAAEQHRQNWQELYMQEKSAMEQLAEPPPAKK